MAGKIGATCSPAAPLSRPANARRWAKKAAEPAEKPGKHKRSTRGAQEEHKSNTRGTQESNRLSSRYPLACLTHSPRGPLRSVISNTRAFLLRLFVRPQEPVCIRGEGIPSRIRLPGTKVSNSLATAGRGPTENQEHE